MKIFQFRKFLSAEYKKLGLLMFVLLGLQACTTYKVQYGKSVGNPIDTNTTGTSVAHTFYLIGDAGNADEDKAKQMLELFKNRLQSGTANSTAVFLGDNIYPKGMPPEDSPQRKLAEEKIDNQLALIKGFKGQSVFINGNHDWYNGYEGVKRQADYIVEKTGNKKAVLPRKVCGIERLKIDDNVVLLTIDSEWFLQDWDKHPNINEDCDIKTRDDFFQELRSLLNKNQNRTVVVAMHHPVYSNGSHGGYYSLRKHIYPYKNIPAPILGSVVNYLRKTSGGSPQEIQNRRYLQLAKRVRTLVQGYENVVLVSGHEHTLQYIEKEGIKQVISGAGSKEDEARAIQPMSFSSGSLGYATLEVMTDKTTWLSFYKADEGKENLLFRKKIIEPKMYAMPSFSPLDSIASASVYPKEWTQKTAWYRLLWGKHYRKYYGVPVQVPVADLTQIHGGLTPVISGGGNQSMSLRLVDSEGKEYVIRGVRKSASRFAQNAVFMDQYIEEDIKNTFAERFIFDYYTTAHPFTPFIIGNLTEKAGIFHTNPELYYIPKQPALQRYNEVYGDQLYMIEERPTDGHEEDSFGNAEVIISTDDVIKNLRKNSNYTVDQKAFLKARLFDILVGDWDRHADQWRWAEFKENNRTIYKPIPRDRDQAFAKIDGVVLKLIKKLPILRHMQSFTPTYADPRWINKTAFPLDQLLLKDMTQQDWEMTAKEVAEAIDDKTIGETFKMLPVEVQDEGMNEIITTLKARRAGLEQYAVKFYKELRRYVVLSGTDKEDAFNIERKEDGKVEITHHSATKEGKQLAFHHIYNPETTKEIWIYGLNDKDEFKVHGEGKTAIKIRLIGGKNHDTFEIDNPKKVIVYDYKDKNNTIAENNGSVKKVISNRYDLNNFDYRKLPLNVSTLLPNIGYNPDDGLWLGVNYTATRSKFIQDPFTSKHQIKANFAFATQGFDLGYKGYFANTANNWMWVVGAAATTPNFAQNYYGIGNETYYFDEEKGDNFKRVRIESYKTEAGYRYEGDLGGEFQVSALYEAVKVQKTAGRFITQPGVVDEKLFDFQHFAGVALQYDYEQYNSVSRPSLGFGFHALTGWKTNLEHKNQDFGFLDLKMNFDVPMDQNERFVLASSFKYKTRFGNNYQFYHASALGGNGELRGFRPERFTGKTAFVQSTDIRWNTGQITGGIVPMNYGLYAGFDYGRVWTPMESSDKWHNSYGLGIWVNAIESLTLQSSYFKSEDGGRFVVGLGFGF